MSNPQRQVGNRRLPPLLKVNSAFVKVDHSTSGTVASHTGSHKSTQSVVPFYKVCSQLPYELTSAFLEGPFRPAIPLDSIGQFGFNSGFTSPILTDLGNRALLDSNVVEVFLKDNPDFLQDFVRIHVAKQQLERWLEEKVKLEFDDSFAAGGLFHAAKASAKWKNCSCVERQHFMEDFVNDVHRVHSDVRGSILNQLVDSCASAVDADGHILYLTDNEGKHIWPHLPHSSKPISLQEVKEGTTIACYVAASKETIRTTQILGDERFPKGIGVQDTTAYSVMCQPIIQPSGDLTGVIELIRVVGVPPFTEKDEQVVNSYLTWGGIVLHYAEMYHTMHKQRKLNEFLLNVTKSIFQDIVSMDTVIMKIMNFAQTLVDADRTSLFLVDTRTNELYARIFDIGTGLDTKLQKEIRFPKNKGVAGHVATTGETLNITDAYSEPRFNRDIDVQTGYTTRTLLCMPIFIRGNIIGVVQMVNKKSGVFTAADEKAFQTFAVYCGLALHHAKLYDKIRRSEQKYKVALEVLSYHSMCSEEELIQLRLSDIERVLPTIDRFEFNCYEFDGIQMAKMAIYMFSDIFNFERFDPDVLTRFVLTVRKNYRRVPYHNWTHAFSVAHCMYSCIKKSGRQIPDIEAVSLFVACLCHDLDHRGKNNDWMKSESTPLAAVYTTSTLEHHHFNQTITILQHEGHNIFAHFTSSDYKQVLGYVKDCILSTDLATFFGNKARLKDVLDVNGFSWDNIEHRKMVRALAMTACDLSACAKPWKIQYETVKVIFQEFYAQGDEEKALGRTPVPMMDRDTADKLPQHQVGFLVGICIPCYDLLQRLLPGTRGLLDGAKKNLQRWTEMVSKQNEKRDREREEREGKAKEAAASERKAIESGESSTVSGKKENGLTKAAETFRNNAKKEGDSSKSETNARRKDLSKSPVDRGASPGQRRGGSGSSNGRSAGPSQNTP